MTRQAILRAIDDVLWLMQQPGGWIIPIAGAFVFLILVWGFIVVPVLDLLRTLGEQRMASSRTGDVADARRQALDAAVGLSDATAERVIRARQAPIGRR